MSGLTPSNAPWGGKFLQIPAKDRRLTIVVVIAWVSRDHVNPP